MKVKQLQNVVEVKDTQYVKINDNRSYRTIISCGGWVFEPEYDYPGTNCDEIERLMNLHVDAVEFSEDTLTIWAS